VADNSVDSILCTAVICDIPHPQKAFSEFARILRKGGTVLITMPFLNLYRGEKD
jgi:ubiquinone/menaquinone biosynthesis C-methylase UbiE